LAEIFPNWPNFTQIGAEKTNQESNFGQLERYSTKIVAEIQLRAFNCFLTNFGQKNYCVERNGVRIEDVVRQNQNGKFFIKINMLCHVDELFLHSK
jgi:hypothetical protein